jgi:hypothetical protein
MSRVGQNHLHYTYGVQVYGIFGRNFTDNTVIYSAYTQVWPEPYIYRYIRCICGIFGREITIHTAIYGVYIRFWPTLHIHGAGT